MCGIVGALTASGAIDRRLVAELNRRQHHRGPDDDVLVHEGPCWLGNTRLAIQDPTETGNQPFFDAGGRFVTVFNGEIYNFRSLVARHRLPVTSGCDTEIVPLLWARHGPECLRMLRGMFAVAVFDRVDERLYLARDPFGIKPLHWRRHLDGIVFASEIKPLWRIDRSLPVADEALATFLQFCAVRADRSPFAGIDAVPPGACVSFGVDGQLRTELVVPALDNPLTDGGGSLPNGSERPLAAALFDTVEKHLISDVPTALLLSAGVDSSTLAYAASKLGQTLHCLTVTGALGDDETAQARATVAEFGHVHERVSTALDGAALDTYFSAMQRPTIDGLNTFLVSQAVAGAGFKVALSGLGGDEALGGYSTARVAQLTPLLRALDRLPANATAAVVDVLSRRAVGLTSVKAHRLLAPGGPRTAGDLIDLQRELFPHETLDRLGIEPRLVERAATGSGRFGPTTGAEVSRYLRPVLLADADAFSMACSVELRVPFVDREFFAVASRRRRLRGKHELVAQLDNRYLTLLSRRPKTGFVVPMAEWMKDGVLADTITDAARPDAPIWSLVDRDHGLTILRQPTARWSERWALASLDGWLRSL